MTKPFQIFLTQISPIYISTIKFDISNLYRQYLEIMSKRAKQILKFCSCTIGIYACHLVAAVIHQKIFKTPYFNTQTHVQDYYTLVLPLHFIPALISTLLGYMLLSFQEQDNRNHFNSNDNRISSNQDGGKIPHSQIFICSGFDFAGSTLSNLSIIFASYIAVTMVHTCGLLSVILVSIFCSRVTDTNLRIGKQKILVGIIVCLGIFVFNNYTQSDTTSKHQINHPLNMLTAALLAGCLICEGFKADFQAQIKSKYQPSAYQLYYLSYRATAVLCFIGMLVTTQLFSFIQFLYYHDSFIMDILLMGFLSAIGDIMIYKLIKQFRQHVTPFVLVIRKFLTLIVNLYWFQHPFNLMQGFGMFVLFCGVMLEIYMNLKQRQNQAIMEIPRKLQQNQDGI